MTAKSLKGHSGQGNNCKGIIDKAPPNQYLLDSRATSDFVVVTMEKTKKAAGAGSEEDEICRRKVSRWRCKNASADNEVRYCEKHFEEMKKLPPDEHRCSHTSGKEWRCKNFRMSHDAAADDDSVPRTKLCENHYNYYVNYCKYLKKRSRDGLCVGSSSATEIHKLGATIDENHKKRSRNGEEEIFRNKTGRGRCKNTSADNELHYCDKHYKDLPPDEHRCSKMNGMGWRCKNFRNDTIIPKTKYCEKHYNYIAKYNQMLRKRTSRDHAEGAGSGHIEEEIRGLKRRRKKVTMEEDDRCHDDTFDSHTIVGGGESAKIGAKRKKIEKQTSAELKSSTGISEAVAELKNMEDNNTKCFQVSGELELAKKELELAKINVELSIDEDATEYWRNKCSDLENLVLTLEIENLTMRYEDSSIFRCEELRNSEKIKCAARGVQNEITQTGEKQSFNYNMCKPNAETNCGGKDSHVYESSSQVHDLEMSKKTFVNLVSESDDSGDSLGEPDDSTSFVDSKLSFGDPMKNSNRNNDELDWKSFLGFPFSYTFGLD